MPRIAMKAVLAMTLALAACDQGSSAPVSVSLTIDVMPPGDGADLGERIVHSDACKRLGLHDVRLTARGRQAVAITFEAPGRTHALELCRALGHAVLADDVRGPLEVRFRD